MIAETKTKLVVALFNFIAIFNASVILYSLYTIDKEIDKMNILIVGMLLGMILGIALLLDFALYLKFRKAKKEGEKNVVL